MAGRAWTYNEIRHFRKVVAEFPFETWARIAKVHGYGRSPKSVQARAKSLNMARGIRPRKIRTPLKPWDCSRTLLKAMEVTAPEGKTLTDVAVEAGISRRTVARWRKGYAPQLRLLVQWAEAAGTSAAEICRIAEI